MNRTPPLMRRCKKMMAGLSLLATSAVPFAAFATLPECTPEVFNSPDLFNCVPPSDGVIDIQMGPPVTFNGGAADFPTEWLQYGFDQKHNTVFPAAGDPDKFPASGVFWVAPLTGIDFINASRSQSTFGNIEGWASRTSQVLGEVMGVSAVKGIVYAQLGRREMAAIDARTGRVIWRREIINAGGMGQSVVREVDGGPVVFVTVGDAMFNIQNAIRFANGLEHERGAEFGAVVALDGVTGDELWRVSMRNSARPAAIVDGDRIYVATNSGEFLVLNADTGAQIGFAKNPGNGTVGLASPNWYENGDGDKFVYYGTIRPRRVVGMNVTNPANPVLAWEFSVPNATANATGDTPVAVDPDTGIVYTTVFSAINGTNHLFAWAIDGETGAPVWNTDMGAGDNPPGYKGSVPLIQDGVMYTGNTINETFLALNAATGALLWSTDLTTPDDEAIQRPRAAPVIVDGKLIHASGRHIRTFDPATGEILNDFVTAGNFALFGISQPAVVGDQMYLSSISGWVFGVPVKFVTTNPGVTELSPEVPLPPQAAAFLDEAARPSEDQAASFPDEFLFYAGGPTNNAVVEGDDGADGVTWQTPLTQAVPLSDPPVDEAIYGTEEATMMTHLTFGAGSGLAAANGTIFAGSDRHTVHALNAFTGEEIWRFRTLNSNFGQPLVTPTSVIISGGDQFTNLGGTGQFSSGSAAFTLGGSSQMYMTGLDPLTGSERWVFYTGGATSGMTPLFHDDNVLWVDGAGKLNALNADTGQPVAPFMDVDGKPVLDLGFNAISCANIFAQRGNKPDLLIVGTANPNQITAVNLETGAVAWTQDLAAFSTASTGFAASSVAVDTQRKRMVGTVLIDADPVTNTATVLAYGMDARTGNVRWTRPLGSGTFPLGFVAPTPVINGNRVYIANPLNNTVAQLNTSNGLLRWQTPVIAAAGRMSWGPGVVVDGKLIQPIGPDLAAFDTRNGDLLNWHPVGGSFTYNNPVVVGKTLYIGNSWGWVSAMPLGEVTGDPADL